MTTRAFNSIQGFSVGQNPQQEIILANGDITTVNFTANGISNLGPIGNVKITGGSPGQTIITDGNGNLTFTGIGGNSAAVMPYFIPSDKSYIVPDNFQGLFSQPIEIDGELEIDGILIEVGTAINATSSQVLFDSLGEITGNVGFTFDRISGNLSLPGNVIATGNIIPTTDLNYNLGNSTHRWKDLYLSGNTIYVGDSAISTSNGNLVLTNGQGGEFVVTGNGITTSTQLVNANTILNVDPTAVTISVDSVSNVAVFTTTGLTLTGNASVGGILTDHYYFANGAPLDFNQAAGSPTYVQYKGTGSDLAASANFTFNPDTNLLHVIGNISSTDTVSANYLVSSQGCVSVGTSTIQVSGSDGGLFNVNVANLNVGLVASNITFGATSSNSTFRGNLISNNYSTTGNVTASNINATKITGNGGSVSVFTDTIIDSFPVSAYRSVKYTIRVGSDIGYQSIEVLLVHDDINSIVTIYGSLSTAGVDLITLSSQIVSGNVELTATALTNNTNVNLIGTYVSD